jgi:CheY-like chemotaxis protein
VLFNLLGNASKFTHGGTIELRVRAESDGARDWIVFDVVDTGIGMSDEQLARLFQPFVQADASTTRKYGGSGLGLAISKQFCELMGGRIAVSSEPGRGTSFAVRLPRVVDARAPSSKPAASREPVIAAPARAPVEPEKERGSVLVIDDDAVTRELLARYLEREGFRVTTASTGDEGIARARAEHPDVITLDVMMPGKDGWIVLADLKADLSTADIPVVMLTIVDQRNAGYALGAADYLLKPVDRTRLLQLIERHLGRQEGNRSALVVDDDDDLRGLLARGLAAEGYEVREAENGRVALDRVSESVPGVILLDLMMPVMDGFAFLEHLRERAEWRTVPVVVVTAMDLTEQDRLSLHGYVEKVVQKGAYPQAELLAEVRRLVDAGLAGRARPRRLTA